MYLCVYGALEYLITRMFFDALFDGYSLECVYVYSLILQYLYRINYNGFDIFWMSAGLTGLTTNMYA